MASGHSNNENKKKNWIEQQLAHLNQLIVMKLSLPPSMRVCSFYSHVYEFLFPVWILTINYIL